MSKAILVLNEQDRCWGCPLAIWDYNQRFLEVCAGSRDKSVYSCITSKTKNRPEWCPLQPAPAHYKDEEKHVVDYKNGWNDCLRELGLLDWEPE